MMVAGRSVHITDSKERDDAQQAELYNSTDAGSKIM
jgi:hypothetical protein